MDGLSSPKTAKIINYAVKCCDKDKECYVEIGTYSGYTLCCAAYQNNVPCVGIDDLSLADFTCPEILEQKKAEVRKKIKNNIAKMVWNKSISFFEHDFRQVKLQFPEPRTIGTLYIDGYHNYDQTMAAFEWAEPMLSDEAIIICDDVQLQQVEIAVLEKVFNGKYKLALFAAHVADGNDMTLDENISTGIAVLQYRRPK
jgi:predicted O-methyltransferase YrrM